jgi:hypothetical protein
VALRMGGDPGRLDDRRGEVAGREPRTSLPSIQARGTWLTWRTAGRPDGHPGLPHQPLRVPVLQALGMAYLRGLAADSGSWTGRKGERCQLAQLNQRVLEHLQACERKSLRLSWGF